MADYKTIEAKRVIMGKLSCGGDLLEELTAVCQREKISLGTVAAIGAVQKANIGYYDQHTRTYHFTEFNRPLEMASLTGNVSLKDGEPMVHAHITLADEKKTCVAGHLGPGTTVFACEFVITVCGGADFVREYDEQTGLPLWTFPSQTV